MTTSPRLNVYSWDAAWDEGLRRFNEPVEDMIKTQKRSQKHIDRMAWKAEAAQRFAKGGHWK